MRNGRIRRRIANWTIAACCALLAGCSETVTPDPPVLAAISVTTSAPSVLVGQSIDATAAGTDQNCDAIPTGAVAGTSSAGASVDATGNVTGVSRRYGRIDPPSVSYRQRG